MKKILLGFALILFVGCATVPLSPTADADVVILHQSYDAYWSRAVEIITGRNAMPTLVKDKGEGIIETDWVVYERRARGMGENMVASSWNTSASPKMRFRYKLSLLIEENGSELKLTLSDQVEEFSADGWSESMERPEKLNEIEDDLLENF